MHVMPLTVTPVVACFCCVSCIDEPTAEHQILQKLSAENPVVHLSEDIHSMTDFQRRTSEFVARLNVTGRPLVLTTKGRAGVLIQDAAAYQKLLDAARSWEAHEALQRELVSTRRVARGHGAK